MCPNYQLSHLDTSAPSILVECLTGDFRGNHDDIRTITESGLDVYAHNLETVDRLQL